MTRLARDFSWHLLALAIVVAGLGTLAPLAWWHARQPYAAMRARRATSVQINLPLAKPSPSHTRPTREPSPTQPQVASLRPPVADQIDLDPSITETPALPSGPSTPSEQA